MDYKFLNVDLSAATFEGLSLAYQRKIALVATAFIWIGMTYASYATALYLDTVGLAEGVASVILFGALVHYIVRGEFIMSIAAKALFKVTPLGVLYRQDKYVLETAKAELLSITQQIQLKDYLEYGKINPAIRSQENQVVIAHQKRGDLRRWIGNTRNLKKLANLIYQIYLVEQFLCDDANQNNSQPVFR